MREAIGGAWLFGIVITFIALFTAFLAYSISYTRAFNVKNQIINMIEESEGYTKYQGTDLASNQNLDSDTSVEGRAFNLIRNMGYNYEVASAVGDAGCQNLKGGNNLGSKMMSPAGYCLTKICENGNKNANTHYKITTFIALQVPVIGIMVKIPISGETRTLYYDNGDYDCSDGGD